MAAPHDTDMIMPANVARTYPIRSYTLQLVDRDGWTATHTYYDLTMDQFEQIKLKLRQRGYTPVADSAHSAPAAPAPERAPVVPICPVHGEPMKQMAKADRQGNTHWCTQKTDGGFCAERGVVA